MIEKLIKKFIYQAKHRNEKKYKNQIVLNS